MAQSAVALASVVLSRAVGGLATGAIDSWLPRQCLLFALL